jgi:hypothetical protein
VRPTGTWCEPFAHGPIVLAPGERRQVVLQVDRGCTISGVMVPAEAHALVAGARLVRAGTKLRLPLGGATFPVEAGGRFRWTGVPAGDWDVDVVRMMESWVEQDASPYRVRALVRVANLQVPAASDMECRIDLGGLLPGRVRGSVTSTAGHPIGGMLRPIGQREGTRWVSQPIVVAADGAFEATLPPGDYRWILSSGRESGGVLLVGNMQLKAGADAVAKLIEPASEEVELVFAPELRRSLQARVWIRYQAAAELRACECMVDPIASFVRVDVVPGEQFLVEAPPHGMIRPEREPSNGDGRRVRYLVRNP